MVVDDKWNQDWALYSGDRFVTIGTLFPKYICLQRNLNTTNRFY